MASQKNNQLDLIKKLLNNDFLESGNSSKILVEKSIMQRNIIGYHGIDYLLYRFDPNETNLFPYFEEKSGLKKICDYFLFATEGSYLHILLIELKRGTASAGKQLVASECFLEFIINSAKRIGINLTGNISVKKIRVSEERAKQRNRKTKPSIPKFDENRIINYDYSTDFRLREVIDVI